MKTIIHGPSRSKVSFINEKKAKVELMNGETWILGFSTPFNFLSGEHFVLLLGWSFDMEWGLSGNLGEDLRHINEKLYHNGYEMIIYFLLEPKISEERKRIGNRIRELRKNKGIDAKELACRIGINSSNLCRIEQGYYSVGIDILTKIASALGAKVDIVENETE